MAANSTVLVVEDDQLGRTSLKKLLQRFDYDAHVISSGEDALDSIVLDDYVCVLVDTLAYLTGVDCTRRIRQLECDSGTHIPVIALTSATGAAATKEAVEAGMDDYLSKPFEFESLRKILLKYVYEPEKPNLKVVCSADRDKYTGSP